MKRNMPRRLWKRAQSGLSMKAWARTSTDPRVVAWLKRKATSK